MASDEKKKPGTGARGTAAKGSSKRPARTIELEAEEIEIEVKTDSENEETADEGDDKSAAGSRKTGTSARSSKTRSTKKTQTKPEEAKTDAPTGGPPPPPQRTGPGELKAFATHLAAGLVGGLIGVVGAGLGLGLMSPGGSGGASSKLPQMEQRIAELDERIAGLPKSAEPAIKPERLEKLESRLAALESKPPPEPAVPQDIPDRLSRLEETLKTLEASAGSENSSALAQATALTARIDTISENLDKRSAALDEKISDLKKTFTERSAASAGRDAEQLRGLEDRLAALEKSIAGLSKKQGATAALPSAANGSAAVLAFESLRRAAAKGEGYAAQLKALKAANTASMDISALEKHAESGVPSQAALLKDLPAVLRRARESAGDDGGTSFVDRLVSSAGSVVRVRRIGPQEGDSPNAVLSRMEDHMKSGELEGVLREAEKLDGKTREILQPWLSKAQARQALDAELDRLEQGLLASLGDEPVKASQR